VNISRNSPTQMDPLFDVRIATRESASRTALDDARYLLCSITTWSKNVACGRSALLEGDGAIAM